MLTLLPVVLVVLPALNLEIEACFETLPVFQRCTSSGADRRMHRIFFVCLRIDHLHSDMPDDSRAGRTLCIRIALELSFPTSTFKSLPNPCALQASVYKLEVHPLNELSLGHSSSTLFCPLNHLNLQNSSALRLNYIPGPVLYSQPSKTATRQKVGGLTGQP